MAESNSIAFNEDFKIVIFGQKRMEIDTLWDLNGLNEILPLFDNLLVQKETQETRFRAKRIGIEIFRKLIIII